MKISMRLIVYSAALLLLPASARAQDFLWAAQLGGAGEDRVGGVEVDADGNVYSAGFFHGTVDFDPGPGTFNLTSAGHEDAFVGVLDRAGNFVWAAQFGGTEGDTAPHVALDASGNVYAVGSFHGTVDFDPGPGTFNLTAVGDHGNAFVSALDSAGGFVWAARLGGTGGVGATCVSVDTSGNVYTVGRFHGTVDFDPGPGTFNLTSVNDSGNVFVSALDSAGDFLWAAQLGGSHTYGVAVDADSNVYTAGYFSGTQDFDPGPGTYNLTSTSSSLAFLSVLDSSGNFVRAGQLGGLALGVAVDASGNAYTVGRFSGTADFDPGPGTFELTSVGDADAYVCVIDSAGDFVWAEALGGPDSVEAWGIEVDTGGNVYTAGIFRGTVDFDPGPGTFNLTSEGSDDAFISVLDSEGHFVWAGHLGGINHARGTHVAVGASGEVYIVGDFAGIADLDPGPGTFNVTSQGDLDVFVSAFVLSGAFNEASRYGTLLFPPRYTEDASSLTEDVYDSATTVTNKEPNDRFFLSSTDASFASLVVDDLVYCEGQDAGLGPYDYQPGVPPFLFDAPIEYNLVPEPAHDITAMLPAGASQLLFELLDTDRAICGNTAVYLLRDCGIWMDEDAAGQTRLNWVSHAVDVVGSQSDLNVVSGVLSELRSDGDFSWACNLGSFVDTTLAVDGRPDPTPGDGYYYLVSGTCARRIGYGYSSAGPRQGLPPGSPCP